MGKKANLTVSQLVGFQDCVLYGRYHHALKELVNEELSDPRPDFQWLICKVFVLGSIAGVRKERARRRRGISRREVKS